MSYREYPNSFQQGTIPYRILLAAILVTALCKCLQQIPLTSAELGYDTLSYPKPSADGIFSPYLFCYHLHSSNYYVVVYIYNNNIYINTIMKKRWEGVWGRVPVPPDRLPGQEPPRKSDSAKGLTTRNEGCTLVGMAPQKPTAVPPSEIESTSYDEATVLQFDRIGRMVRSGEIGKNLLTNNLIRRVNDLLIYTPEVVKQVLQAADIGYFGKAIEMYEKMVSSDTELGNAVGKRKMTGMRTSFITLPSEENNSEADIIKDYVDLILKNLIGWETAAYDLIDGLIYGFTALELEWHKSYPVALHPTNGSDWRWQSAPSSIYANQLGAGLLYKDINGSWKNVPSDKFVIVTPENKKPISQRGPMRSCASWYVMKTLVAITFGSYCEMYGIPRVNIKVPMSWFNDAEKLALVSNGFANMGSEGFSITTDGMEVIEAKSSGASTVAPHESFLAFANRQISKAILSTTLLTDTTGTTGTLSTAEIHQEETDNLFEADIEIITTALQCDLINPMVYYAFGPEADPPILTAVIDNRRRQTENLDRLEKARNIGMSISERYAHSETGIPQPEEGDTLLDKTQAQGEQ